MIVKRKLYSVMDEEGNLGYYLYDESTGEEKMFSVVEDEKMYARGVGMAVQNATRMAQSKGLGAINKAAKRNDLLRQTGLPKFKPENFRTVPTPKSDFDKALSGVRNNSRWEGKSVRYKDAPINAKINAKPKMIREELKDIDVNINQRSVKDHPAGFTGQRVMDIATSGMYRVKPGSGI